MIDDVREDNNRRIWLVVAVAIVVALAIAAFFVGRAQALDARTDPPHSATTSDDEEASHAAQ